MSHILTYNSPFSNIFFLSLAIIQSGTPLNLKKNQSKSNLNQELKEKQHKDTENPAIHIPRYTEVEKNNCIYTLM